MKTLFVGDVSPKAPHIQQLFKDKDIETLFGDVKEIFKGNDLNFINLECALTDSETSIEKFGPPLKAPAETAEVLKSLGVTLCGVSNNHIFDFGIKGWQDTKRALDNAELDYTGFGDNYEDSRKNYVIEKDGEALCVIAVCEHEYSYALDDRMGSRPFELDTFVDVKKAKEKYDRVVVIYHGGKEHCPYPSPRLVKLYRTLAEMGADMVLGQHSHCICSYENYNGSHLFFGQGNFHFVWPNYTTQEWNTSLAVSYDTKTNAIEFIPIVTEENGISLAKGENKVEILSRFKTLCDAMTQNTWQEGWSDFCNNSVISNYSVKKQYIEAIREAYVNPDIIYTKYFGHYLDCEAHTDVWRELNKTANSTNER